MKNLTNIKIKNYEYKVDLSQYYDLSISIDPNIQSPCFYDEKPIKISYYQNKNKTWKVDSNAICNIPLLNINIHCGVTHTECRSHITKEKLTITNVLKNIFTPCTLITVTPSKTIADETYHYTLDDTDLIIKKSDLEKKLNILDNTFLKSLIIRTLPNPKNTISKNYNINNNAFFSNEAVHYLKSLGICNLIVDLPSIDKFDDGGLLGNHRIFWNLDKTPNKNTITELAYIKDGIKDGMYLISLNILNLSLDASPCRPLLYKILK